MDPIFFMYGIHSLVSQAPATTPSKGAAGFVPKSNKAQRLRREALARKQEKMNEMLKKVHIYKIYRKL
jgi:hypothetical protein